MNPSVGPLLIAIHFNAWICSGAVKFLLGEVLKKHSLNQQKGQSVSFPPELNNIIKKEKKKIHEERQMPCTHV